MTPLYLNKRDSLMQHVGSLELGKVVIGLAIRPTIVLERKVDRDDPT